MRRSPRSRPPDRGDMLDGAAEKFAASPGERFAANEYVIGPLTRLQPAQCYAVPGNVNHGGHDHAHQIHSANCSRSRHVDAVEHGLAGAARGKAQRRSVAGRKRRLEMRPWLAHEPVEALRAQPSPCDNSRAGTLAAPSPLAPSLVITDRAAPPPKRCRCFRQRWRPL